MPVYRRQAPGGHVCFQIANYAQGKRRLDSYPDEATALEEAGKLARQLSERNVLAAGMTNAQAADYAAASTIAPAESNTLSSAAPLNRTTTTVRSSAGSAGTA